MKKTICLCLVLLLLSFVGQAQARLTIENNSMRSMTVKVMRGNGGKGTLYKTVTVGSYDDVTVHFSGSGNYFTKTKAVLGGRDPIFRKGNPFRVTNDASGYSILTLTFTIKESSTPLASGGQQISKTEFDQD